MGGRRRPRAEAGRHGPGVPEQVGRYQQGSLVPGRPNAGVRFTAVGLGPGVALHGGRREAGGNGLSGRPAG